MPRQAHGRSLQPGKVSTTSKKKPTRNRGLNALEIAERDNPDQVKIPQHRLGQVDDDEDEPRTRADGDERSSKRRKIDVTLEDEVAEEGSDLEGNRWHEGMDENDEDSNIDSDDAFGASDEDRFADFTFRGSANAAWAPRRRPKPVPVTLDEDDAGSEDDEMAEDEDDDFGDEGVDLATAWDMDDQDEAEGSKKRQKRPLPTANAVDDKEPSLASDEDGDDDQDEASSENEDQRMSDFSVSDSEGDHAGLQDFVEGLATADQAQQVKKRRAVQSLPDKPSQFGLSSTKISAADLLQYIKDPLQRQSLKMMQNNDAKGPELYKAGIPGKLAPPLAKRQQDRLDRSAAYDETNKELGKWTETVKQNRRAEHLSFPLVDAAAAGMEGGKQLGPISSAHPMTALESTIQNIMVESGMLSKDHKSQDDQEQAFEELQEKQMPLVEVQARRAELRQARDLMFREEIRARRIKKIKSKAYRRVHRKERQKVDEANRSLLSAQGLLYSDEEREQNDRRRAEERMGARHKESKWAKSVKVTGRAAWDEDARHGVADLARRDEELRKRIEGKTNLDSDASDSESSGFDGFDGSEDEKLRLTNKLNDLDADEDETPETRLGSMAFMKKAEAARKAANEEELRNIRRSLRNDEDDSGDDADTEDDDAPAGRQKFGSSGKEVLAQPLPQVQKSEFEELESDQELNDVEDRDEEGGQVPPNESTKTTVHAKDAPQSKKPTRQPEPPPIGAASPQDKRNMAIASNEAATKPQKDTRSPIKTSKASQTPLDDYTSSSGSEDEKDEKTALAHAIFAGSDGAQLDFAKEKKDTVQEEGDQVVDNSLPGWGNWAGEGISKKAQKRAKGRSLITIKGVAEDKRQDAKLDKVIINEKRVKKNSKYLASELPHPFESRQQYERALRLPMGPEWTTKTTFQDATKPRVLVKQGIIRPMAKPLA